MRDASLRDYAEDIKQLIDEGRSEEALSHVWRLLQRFPNYWLGYRLLGEVALLLGYTADAVEIFRRVLSIDPDNFVAHAGLATAHADVGELDDAIWHMMRAFELNPAAREVRDQLRHLYRQRDGRAPGRLRLTRAGRARVHMRNHAFDQAIWELQEALEEEEDRVDLRSLFAEAQWRSGRRRAAFQTASELLAELPYGLKANLLVGEFYARLGETEQAGHYLRIAQHLDPENEVAAWLFDTASPLEPHPVPLDEESASGSLPDWITTLDLYRESPEATRPTGARETTPARAEWHERLARATRAALDAQPPAWQRELRRATAAALHDRVTAPDGWHAALREATLTALDGANATRRTPNGAWRAALRVATEWEYRPRLARDMPSKASWVLSLRQGTERAIERRHEEDSPALPSLSPVATPSLASSRQAPEPSSPTPVAGQLLARRRGAAGEIGDGAPLPGMHPPAWVDDLHGATVLALQAHGATGLSPQWASLLRDATREALTLRQATDRPTWATRLQEATVAGLHDAATAPDSAWVDDLHEATLAALPVAGIEPARAEWVAEMRQATADALRYGAEGATAPSLGERLASGAGELLHQVQKVADTIRRKQPAEETAGHPVAGAGAWVLPLRTATEQALASTAEDTSPSLGERLAHSAEEIWHRAQEVTERVRERAADVLSPEPEEEGPSPPAMEEAPSEEAETVAEDERLSAQVEAFWDGEPGEAQLAREAKAFWSDDVGVPAEEVEAEAEEAPAGEIEVDRVAEEEPEAEAEEALAGEFEAGVAVEAEAETAPVGEIEVEREPDAETALAETTETGEPSPGMAEALPAPEESLTEDEEDIWETTVATVAETWRDEHEEEAVAVESEEEGATLVEPAPPPEEQGARETARLEEQGARQTAHLADPETYDEFALADRAWRNNRPREAFEIYQRLFLSGGAEEEVLARALLEWTRGGEAPALVYQLLGDLYRRMGRMSDALAQYREAIRRM